jgi:hypothetical protein
MPAKKVEKATRPVVIEKEMTITAERHSRENLQSFRLLIVGDTPLITHAWSEKAKREMLDKQQKLDSVGREAKDPEADFRASLYPIDEPLGVYGFPATGVKNTLVASAHKDKNIAKVDVRKALFIHGDMTRLMPAKGGAICDVPLLRIWGSAPVMREDMVKIGSGLNKVATLSYRGQFTFWAIELRGLFNPYILNKEKLIRIVSDAGIECGVGEWRNERSGLFGSFHIASREELAEWNEFMANGGPVPMAYELQQAAE